MSLLRAATRQLALRQLARKYASTSTVFAPASLVHTPSAQAADEYGPEPIEPADARLSITERAAEHLRSIAQSKKGAALRIAVESGGCHGYQYKMELAKSLEADDYHFAHPSIQPADVFRITDNPQAKGNGCGCGVSWEAKY
ncbi:hypothetical protein EXIGLDRAFT_213548 [Exidia glandulosa HHB12029]|uniref:Core domain-containing protein n=1 Tax=Exidia glandulosa HHB12029 TaxID=1314781 RepID=A0A165EHC5_EXIGL|nr:hypothetical protein EXIGLDRAFT_213548 [Exidia glandulosa HHB12029]